MKLGHCSKFTYRTHALQAVFAVALPAAIAGCASRTSTSTQSQSGAQQESADTVLAITTMVGVEGAFVKHNAIRGVRGDELPWEIASANGSLTSDGHLVLDVTGVVFGDYPEVPPELRGINDEAEFRGLVSCLSDDGRGKVATVNLVTEGFPATRSGDSSIDAVVELPEQCVAPIIFVMSGSEDFWFAVTGSETEED